MGNRRMNKALGGKRVLDLTYALNGPLAGRILAELGAEVIKIEPPWGSARDFLPLVKGESVNFVFINAGKKFITLNLKKEEGKEIFKRLVKVSDVVLENFTPGTMEKLGLGYEELKKVNPNIIYASSSGFGYSGPYKYFPAYDYIIQAMTGFYYINGTEEMPIKTGVAIIDVLTGVSTALAIITAIYYKEKTGLGQRIDIAMFDVAFYSLVENLAGILFEGEDSRFNKRLGNKHPVTAPYALYKCKNGFVFIAIAKDEQFARLCKAINRGDLINNDKFKKNEDRVRNVDELDKYIEDWTSKYECEEVEEILRRFDVACAKIRKPSDALKDRQVLERELIRRVNHPVLGGIPILNSFLKLSLTPGEISQPGYPLGYHNEQIYGNLLGFNRDTIRKLRDGGVI